MSEGGEHLFELLKLIKTESDLRITIYFLFRIDSLSKLKDYSLYEKYELKKDSFVQILFFYILS